MGWRSLSRSAIGTRHRQHYLPCQDAGGHRSFGDVVIGAIADGSGSAPHSAIGAALAVKSTLDYLSHLETWLQPHDNPQWPTAEKPPSPPQVQRLFERTLKQVRDDLQQQAAQNHYGLETLACTLLAFVATPHWIAAMQIGDGFMVVSTPARAYQLLFAPDKGEFVNQTAFVTSSTALQDLQTRAIAEPPQFICAATDAFERLAMHLPAWEPHPAFFKPLEAYLGETPNPEQDDAYIMSFLESEYLNRQTDDDKTLLLCRWAA
ncbi:PP2C family serine/threonine-protein phosphatase [Altericista sp. CCNU0014]|uniref:PP2C family serine/threonine-protein phosphatase n=1 Tax=Altericista sp. CCNU0014 TaxID=3082949 RepID=UPI00384A52B7